MIRRWVGALLIAACSAASSCGKVEHLGPSWVVRYGINVSELRDTRPELFAKTRAGEVKVTDQIESYIKVARDCVAFSSFVDGEYYFACSGRRPILLQTTGLRGRATLVVHGERLSLIDNGPRPTTRLVFSIENIRRIASRQPQLHEHWRDRPKLDTVLPTAGS